ncbi:extracellular calcium-sensing receptor-like [Ambystoma mexicanum]|uniref:extracellular calcium-sensing receptor-like n=1 Tax=Ambystoma mexicanum TaxID=8296 RepID=UPI0037E89C55
MTYLEKPIEIEEPKVEIISHGPLPKNTEDIPRQIRALATAISGISGVDYQILFDGMTSVTWFVDRLFDVIYYRIAQSAIFATEEINKKEHLLPNTTLGFSIYGSCDSVSTSLLSAMHLLTGKDQPIPNFGCKRRPALSAFIAEDRSALSIPIARLLGIYKVPQVSYASSVNALSDKTQFPSFLRTTPSDDFQAYGIAKLVLYFGWSWVGILAEDNDYGLQGSLLLKKELEKAGVCIEFQMVIPTVFSAKITNNIVDAIEKSTARAIVIFSTDNSLYQVMLTVANKNITGKIWLASDGWATFSKFSTRRFFKTCEGILGFSIRRGYMPGFKEFLNRLSPSKTQGDIFIRTFWEQLFSCQWPSRVQNGTGNENKVNEGSRLCTGSETLEGLDIPFLDMSDLSTSYNAYNAVYAVAHALHNLKHCQPGEGPFVNRSCADAEDFEPWQLLHYIRKVNFTNSNGEEIFFDANGNPPGIYDILNWQVTPENTFSFLTVGRFDSRAPSGQELTLNQSAIIWNGGQRQVPRSVCSESCPLGYRKTVQPGKPTCCFDCTPCSEGEISNQTDSTECMKCSDDDWPNQQKDTCVKKPMEYLSYEEPLGAILAAASTLTAVIPAAILMIFIKSKNTPLVKANNRELSYLLLVSLSLCALCSLVFIGRPVSATCLVRQVAFGITFALCLSCILAKTIIVVIAFKATTSDNKLKQWVGPQLAKSIVIVATSIQIILCVLWLTITPPFVGRNSSYHIGKIIMECNDGSSAAFWGMLGYMGLLAMVSFVVAFISRKLPDSFNEAKFITFSMLVFVSVWLSFVPAYLSTRGKYMVAVEIFAILASSSGLMACIFLPKCYIILLRPDMNTKEFLMGRGKFSTKKLK